MVGQIYFRRPFGYPLPTCAVLLHTISTRLWRFISFFGPAVRGTCINTRARPPKDSEALSSSCKSTMSDIKHPKTPSTPGDGERGALGDQAFVATLTHGGGDDAHGAGGEDVEGEGNVDGPLEDGVKKGKRRLDVKRERRFLLKLDLYLITWAFCAYLIKVGVGEVARTRGWRVYSASMCLR